MRKRKAFVIKQERDKSCTESGKGPFGLVRHSGQEQMCIERQY